MKKYLYLPVVAGLITGLALSGPAGAQQGAKDAQNPTCTCPATEKSVTQSEAQLDAKDKKVQKDKKVRKKRRDARPRHKIRGRG